MSKKKPLAFISLAGVIMITAAVIFTSCATNPYSSSISSHTKRVQPTVTPIGGLSPYGGKLVMNDSLSDNALGLHWDENTSITGSCRFSNGSYLASENTSEKIRPCVALNTDFSDLAFEVKMTILDGNYGGIYIRRDSIAHTGYEFVVDSYGFYILAVRTSLNQVQTLQEGPAASFHKGYNQSNVLAAVARGSTIDLYVNQQHLVTVQDTRFTHGAIGVMAQDHDTPTQVSYNDAAVWQF